MRESVPQNRAQRHAPRLAPAQVIEMTQVTSSSDIWCARGACPHTPTRAQWAPGTRLPTRTPTLPRQPHRPPAPTPTGAQLPRPSPPSPPMTQSLPAWPPPLLPPLPTPAHLRARAARSVGCLILELITGAPPYYDLNAMSAMFRIVKARGASERGDPQHQPARAPSACGSVGRRLVMWC
jgi:hypothetical protein